MKDNRYDETLLDSAKNDLEAVETATAGRSKLKLVKVTVMKIRSDIKAGATNVCGTTALGCTKLCSLEHPMYGVTV
jgi:hypothetical protein